MINFEPMFEANFLVARFACVGVDGGQLLLAPSNWTLPLLHDPSVVGRIAITASSMTEKHYVWVLPGFEVNALGAYGARQNFQCLPSSSRAAVFSVSPVVQAVYLVATIALEWEKVQLLAVRHGAVLSQAEQVSVHVC